MPADHILWTPRVADIAAWLKEPVQGQAKPSGFQVWVPGGFSKKALAELQGLGWELHPNAQSKLFPETKQKS